MALRTPFEPNFVINSISELLFEYAIPVSVATKVVNGAKTWKQIKNLQQFMGTSKASKIAQRKKIGYHINESVLFEVAFFSNYIKLQGNNLNIDWELLVFMFRSLLEEFFV